MAFQRARSPEHKQQRRTAILVAAHGLASDRGVRSVTLGDIATEVGIAKSALLKYFETREEIYLAVAEDEWQAWVDDAVVRLSRLRTPSPDSVARVLAQSLAGRPLLCDLFSQMAAVLERNVSVEAAVRYKRGAGTRNDALAAALATALPDLGCAGALLVVETAVILTAGLWPMSTPSPALAAALASDPSLTRHQGDFTRRITRTLTALILGDAAIRAPES